ncbi:MAG: YaiI/YqxD family protein [Oscillospiraceae bacterium]|nr:YaiI/YqxD family protein [Oscillospiraceae bacterium]MBQ8884616.1 YaiI/YqxD family protein [Oscillospiraceae bacterium]
MKIYIDADGCPVVKNTIKIAKQFSIPCVIICDTSHRIELDGAETIVVSQGADSVDFRLVNMIQKGDIVVTQDYGLAAMCLGKSAIAIHQDGKQYTNDNIGGLLEFRAIGKKIRRSGGRTKGLPKRTEQQNIDFEKALYDILKSI